jgi:E3 ubiquitin-protein ligase UBR1
VQVPEEVRGCRKVFDVSSESAPNPEDAKKRAAKARQLAIMQQMKEQQASFAINFEDVDDDEDVDMEEEHEQPVSYGTCIVCQEDLNSGRSFGALGLIQPSRSIRRHPDSLNMHLNEVLQTDPSLNQATPATQYTLPPSTAEIIESKSTSSGNFEGFPATYTRFGLHSCVCSHMMHLDCFQQYSLSIRQRHRMQATRNHLTQGVHLPTMQKSWKCHPSCDSPFSYCCKCRAIS